MIENRPRLPSTNGFVHFSVRAHSRPQFPLCQGLEWRQATLSIRHIDHSPVDAVETDVYLSACELVVNSPLCNCAASNEPGDRRRHGSRAPRDDPWQRSSTQLHPGLGPGDLSPAPNPWVDGKERTSLSQKRGAR